MLLAVAAVLLLLAWERVDFRLLDVVEVAVDMSQGWLRMAARLGRSCGRIFKQPRIRSSHSADTRRVKVGLAVQMASSASNGMSPQTMSNNKIPRDHTVRGSAR